MDVGLKYSDNSSLMVEGLYMQDPLLAAQYKQCLHGPLPYSSLDNCFEITIQLSYC